MIKAVLIDHMGTLVYEQSEYLEKLMSVLRIALIVILKRLQNIGLQNMMNSLKNIMERIIKLNIKLHVKHLNAPKQNLGC